MTGRRTERAGLFAGLCLATWTAAVPIAGAAPAGGGLQRLPFTCNSQQVVVTISQGAAHWVNDQHGVLKSLTITFTPTGGSPQVVYNKTYGNRKGLSDKQVECDATFVQPNGTLTFEATSFAVP